MADNRHTKLYDTLSELQSSCGINVREFNKVLMTHLMYDAMNRGETQLQGLTEFANRLEREREYVLKLAVRLNPKPQTPPNA